MTEIRVTASKSYDIKIDGGILNTLGAETAVLGGVQTAAVISDDTVFALYGAAAMTSLESAGIRAVSFVFPHGEQSKCLDTFAQAVNFLAKNRLTRRDIVVALGGGVAGDLAGFTAACYLRGVRYIQVPTTLLAAVDSSVGGKTAVDLDEGKNLCGAFHQPSLVLCDYKTLETLPRETFQGGCAEVIKYGMLGNREFLDFLAENDISDRLPEVIATCVSMKRDIVGADEFDTGKRQLLNFGHTVGHAVEARSGFKLSHGCSVAVGMAIVTRAAVKRGICGAETEEFLMKLLDKYSLPSRTEYSADELFELSCSDKKVTGGDVNLIVPREPGLCVVQKTPLGELHGWIKEGL